MQFKIGFEKIDRDRLRRLWEEILDTQQWSEGLFTDRFEENWSVYNSKQSIAFSSWGGAVLVTLEYFNVRGGTVLCPSNSFMGDRLCRRETVSRPLIERHSNISSVYHVIKNIIS